ncbi:hypothetical protein BH23GEM9_BH23GEM9_20150 [soil metagenome]
MTATEDRLREETGDPHAIPWHERLFLSPWAVGGSVVLTIIAGLLASASPAVILEARPWHTGLVVWRAVAFWAVVLAAAGLYIRRQVLVDRLRAAAQSRLADEAAELKRQSESLSALIRTMPPRDFLGRFRNAVLAQDRIVSGMENAPPADLTADTVRRGCRTVLESVLTLAINFDGRPQGVVYGANLMVYIPREELAMLDDEECAHLRTLLRFASEEADILSFAGVLNLDPLLSAATDSPGGQVDRDLAAFCLPMPGRVKTENGRWRILPGAPMAHHRACSGLPGHDAYADTRSLGDWCRREGAFDPETIAEIETYFGAAGDRIRSFTSIALTRDGTAVPRAVLNIHRGEPGVLRDRGAAEHFYELMAPFGLLILRLLELLDRVVDREDHGPAPRV